MAKREDVLRWAAPVAFLAAVTIAVLLIRAGLNAGGPATTTTDAVPTIPTTTPVVATTTAAPTTNGATTTTAGELYVVQSGDTYGSIATKHRTTVQDLERLNPGVSSTSLSVGQKIRVK